MVSAYRRQTRVGVVCGGRTDQPVPTFDIPDIRGSFHDP